MPLFPGGKEESKFSEKEIIQIMEWAVPAEWRSKFNLDNYTPADHSKAKFIEECEAMERYEKEHKSVENKNSKSQKKEKFKKGGKFNGKKERRNSTVLSMDGTTLMIQRNVSHCRIRTKRMVKNPIQKRNRSFSQENL